MKKIVSVMLAVVLAVSCAFAFAGCSKKNNAKYDVVLLTDGATVTDGAQNESAWNGVKAYCDEKNLSYRYFQPGLDENGELTVDCIKNYFELAANAGAKYIVLPGDAYSVAVHEYAGTYKDIKFLLVDAKEKSADGVDSTDENVMCIDFNELQAGFLAGYSSVIDGFTKLGYFGSVKSETSGGYGAGYVQGAAYAADQLGVPVSLDYADYDSPILNYDYTVNVKPEYVKIPTDKDGKKQEDYFTIKVVNGQGSGTYKNGENVTITAAPAEKGKAFDHWEKKSDTDGVKDKKVNISSDKKSTMNLLVGDCDATITAVYKDADTVPINIVVDSETKDTLNVLKDSKTSVTAPAAKSGYVFDHWESQNQDAISDAKSVTTDVSVSDKGIDVTAVYVKSENPTFNVVVENGSGSGSYVKDEVVNIVADAPAEGMMFSKWVNADNQGLACGLLMKNELSYSTNFTMVDRFASVVEKMIDGGDQVVFGGGNPLMVSIYTAGENFDFKTYGYNAGFNQSSRDDCWASVVTDYGAAVKLALESYKGGTTISADCSNNCLYVTNKSLDKNDKDNYNEKYAAVYKELASTNSKIKLIPVSSGADVRLSFTSKCLTLNYWIKEGKVEQGVQNTNKVTQNPNTQND